MNGVECKMYVALHCPLPVSCSVDYTVRGVRSEIASVTSVISNNVIYCYTVLCHMLSVCTKNQTLATVLYYKK